MTPSDRFNTTEDLFEIRFKKNGQYNVQGLSAGMDVQPGFWGLYPFSHSDYEIRFCASHEDAVEYGTPLAEEIAAEKTKSRKDSPTWTEGAGDRWRSGPAGVWTKGRKPDVQARGTLIPSSSPTWWS